MSDIQLNKSALKTQAVIGIASVATGFVGSYIGKKINPDYGTTGFMLGSAIAPIVLIIFFNTK